MAVVEDAVKPSRPLPWQGRFSNKPTIESAARRNLSDLIKVEVPDLPKDTDYTPWRVRVDLPDGTRKIGIARTIGIDGSVGIQWDDRPAQDLQYVNLSRYSYKWLGPTKSSADKAADLSDDEPLDARL